jgi:hypothetical protein
VPSVVIDVKGGLPNLLLAFPDFHPVRLEPRVEREEDTSADAIRARSSWRKSGGKRFRSGSSGSRSSRRT